MPNDTANNMADTIHQLEEDRIMLSAQLTDLQLAYNEQMLELKKAKRLLKAAVEDIRYLINHTKRDGKACDRCKYGNEMYCYADDCSNDAKWQHADEALALIEKGGDTNE